MAFQFMLPFYNVATFNTHKPELLKKEKAIISLIINIFIGGMGTLLYGLSKICENSNLVYWKKCRHILYGLIQITGFILFFNFILF